VFGEGCPNTEYRTPNTVRTAGDREAPVEEAVPAVFREPVPERSEEREDRRREALLSILRRFVLHRILASSEEVAAWYGLTMEETEAVLRDLEALGAVISVPGSAEESTASPIPHSPLTTDPSPLLWASPEHLEGAYAATLARWRREAKPASMAEYQRFLLHWQRRAGGGQRSAVGSRPDDSDHPVIRSSSTEGPDAVERALAQLQGLPLPATVWEGEVLARRVPGYQPVWLDQVCSTGEFLWQGSPGSFSGRGRVAFFQRELFPFWPGSGEWSAVSGEEGSVESLTTRIAELLERRGASFLLDLSLALGVDSRDVAVALWELIWAGMVTHDQGAVIRAGPPAGRPVPGAGGAVGTRHSGWGRAGRPGRGRPVFGSGGLSRGGSGGRYSWLPALRPAGGAVGTAESETAACREEETIGLVARQLLERYGIVARELLELEALPFSWGSLYPVLHGMELTGEVRRGYFVEGFSGAQFGLPRACDELKAIQERGALGASAFLLLNTCDPANLYGGAVRLQGPESESLSLPRLPGNYLVLRDGVPALLLETGSRRLSPLLTLTADELTAACQALRDLTEHRWPLRPVRQLRLERWGDRPIRGSEAEAPLREIGLSLSPKGLEL
jgi:ATP-dependent Lhr-like helicase